MGNWFALVAPATAVVGLLSAVVGVALGVARIRKILREGKPPAPDFRALSCTCAPASVAMPAARRSRWRLGLVVLAAAAVVAVSLWYSPRPSPDTPRPAGVAVREVAPAPRDVSAPAPPEVDLTAGPFTGVGSSPRAWGNRPLGVNLRAGPFTVWGVPEVFDKAAQAFSYPVTGSTDSPGWLIALSRKVESGVGSKVWYAQSVTPIGDPDQTMRWGNWASGVIDAEVCLLAVFNELPAGLRTTPDYGSVSEDALDGLYLDRAVRSVPRRVSCK